MTNITTEEDTAKKNMKKDLFIEFHRNTRDHKLKKKPKTLTRHFKEA